MKAVLISIRPQWCELIALNKKTDEIRKDAPQLQTPFKVYIYQTKRKWLYKLLEALSSFQWARTVMEGQQRVIGEFICDMIEQVTKDNKHRLSRSSCVPLQDMYYYAAGKSIYNLKAWHISDLVIYDKPKSLTDFAVQECLWHNIRNNGCIDASGERCYDCRLKRPPQSWCYVEELPKGE